MNTYKRFGYRVKRDAHLFWGAGALTIAAVEIILCFVGPLAFLQKPNLVLFPLYSSSLSKDQIEEAGQFLEKQLVLTHSYTVVGHRFIVEYFVRTNPDFDRSKISTLDYEAARKLAKELGLRRFALGWAYSYAGTCDISLAIWDPSLDQAITRAEFKSTSFASLLDGKDDKGNPIDFVSALRTPVKGIGPADILVLGVFALQVIVGLLLLRGSKPQLLVEIVWASLSVLFLFNYIYATNANMDYMQRYIATTGQLRLAIDTTTERLFALVRYLPSLILLGLYWFLRPGRYVVPMSDRGLRTIWLRINPSLTRWSIPLVALSALLYGLAFPSAVSLDGVGVLAWFALVPVFFVLLSAPPKRALFCGVYFGMLQGLFINYWHGTYDYISLHLISIAIIVEYLLFMIALVPILRLSRRWGFISLSLAWVAFDWLRSAGTLGYPWGIAGTTQYQFLPLIQIASITGIWGLDFLVIFVNAAIAWSVAGLLRWWDGPLSSNGDRIPVAGVRTHRSGGLYPLIPFVAAAVLFATAFGGGSAILSRSRARIAAAAPEGAIRVVLLQPNCDPRKSDYVDTLDRLISLTDQAIAGMPGKPDLVAWPEGAFMLDVRYWTDPSRTNSYWAGIVQRFLNYQKGLGTWLATGTQDHGMGLEGGEVVPKNFNSSMLLDPNGRIVGIYHKIHLVPFGEYFPWNKKDFAALYDLFKVYEISDWGLGDRYYVYDQEDAAFSTPICFEDVFPDGVRRYVRNGAQMIVNMSNDYWSLNPVEGRQHAILALFRAVENQRPFLRTTASGYTVAVDATGRIQPGSPEAYTPGYLVASVSRARFPLTFYTIWGDWFIAAAVAALALVVIVLLVLRAVSLVRSRRLRIESALQDRGGERDNEREDSHTAAEPDTTLVGDGMELRVPQGKENRR